MTQLTSDLTGELDKALKNLSSWLVKQKSFAEILQAVQEEAHEGLATVGVRAQGMFSKLLEEFELAARRITDTSMAANRKAEAESAKLLNVRDTYRT